MASQIGRISGSNISPNWLRQAQIQAQSPLLFQREQIAYDREATDKDLALRQESVDLERSALTQNAALGQDQLELAKKKRDAEEEAQRMRLGLEIGRLGIQAAPMAQKSLIPAAKPVLAEPFHSQLSNPGLAANIPGGGGRQTGSSGIFSGSSFLGNMAKDMTVGNTLMPGIAGLAGSQFIGGGGTGGTLKKIGLGAGLGAGTGFLTSLMGGPSASGLTGSLMGGLFGGIGGALGSFF